MYTYVWLWMHMYCCCCLVAKSFWLFWDPVDCSPPGSSAPGISQARILEWVSISFSRGSSQPREWTHISYIGGGLFTTELPGKPIHVRACLISHLGVSDSVTHQAPLFTGFSRQAYWSGLWRPLPGDLSDLGVEPASLSSPLLASGFFTTSATWKVYTIHVRNYVYILF